MESKLNLQQVIGKIKRHLLFDKYYSAVEDTMLEGTEEKKKEAKEMKVALDSLYDLIERLIEIAEKVGKNKNDKPRKK